MITAIFQAFQVTQRHTGRRRATIVCAGARQRTADDESTAAAATTDGSVVKTTTNYRNITKLYNNSIKNGPQPTFGAF